MLNPKPLASTLSRWLLTGLLIISVPMTLTGCQFFHKKASRCRKCGG